MPLRNPIDFGVVTSIFEVIEATKVKFSFQSKTPKYLSYQLETWYRHSLLFISITKLIFPKTRINLSTYKKSTFLECH